MERLKPEFRLLFFDRNTIRWNYDFQEFAVKYKVKSFYCESNVTILIK